MRISELVCLHFSTQQAKCLWKSSLQVSRLRFPQKLPGEIYDADQQCAWLFGKASKHCIYNVGKVSVTCTCKAEVMGCTR